MKKIILLSALVVNCCFAFAQSLVSMSPNTIVQGQTQITSTITGLGTVFQNGSPPNSIVDVYLSGPTTIYGDIWGTIVTDDLHADVPFYVPVNAAAGSYSLTVTYYDCCPGISTPITLMLPSAFTVLPPDGYAQGTVYEDVNKNGVQDGGEAGLAGVTIIINPGNFATTTDASGNYSYPLSNGSYTVTYNNFGSAGYMFITSGSQSTLNFTINNANSTGNNFPVHRGLSTIYPDSAWLGQIVYVTVTSPDSIFRPSNVTLNNTRLYKIASGYTITAQQYTYIDSTTAIFKFTIPNNSIYLGNYDLQVYINTPFTGLHKLPNCFSVVTPPLYMNGTVFLDSDSNGVQGPLEPGLASKKLLLMPDSTLAFTDYNGDYFFGSSSGTKTITLQPAPGFYLAPNNVPSYTATVNTTTSGYDFGLLSVNGNYGCNINYFYGTPRCFQSNYWTAQIQNNGNNAYNGWVYIIKSANVSFGTPSPATTYVNGDTAAWYVTNLVPFESRFISIKLALPGAGAQFTARSTFKAVDAGGITQCTKSSGGIYTTTCSFDPNDKTATPEGVYAQHYTLMSDTLEYRIRFQNTGNDTAFVVVVRDTIDADLDLNTFEVKGASHTMNTELDLQTRVAKFTFNNILLPDSNVNEPESHGYIIYSIRAKASLPNNTLVTNDADIYFDFNPPVITNETFNMMVYVIPVGISEMENNLFNVKVIPNPFENFASIQFDNEKQEMFVLKIYSIDGKLVDVISSNQNNIALNREKMNSGLYLFELKNNSNRQIMRGKFVVK